MKKSDQQLLDEITINGLFSEYLPPCFQFDKKILDINPPEKYDCIEPLSYSMSKFNKENSRRYISIPEIISYISVYQLLKKEGILKKLIELTNQNEVSFSHIIGPDGSIITYEKAYQCSIDGEQEGDSFSLYIQNVINKINKSSGARGILHLDIANCYSSFYTHLIPSILLGYDEANNNYLKSKNKEPDINQIYIIFKSLDDLIRQQNLNRTNGLLIGPLYSRILTEGILTRIDYDIKEKHPNIKYVRYVDDYEIFIYDGQSIDEIINIFGEVLKKYGFSINSEKTEVINFPFYIIDDLKRIFADTTSATMDDSNTMQLFNDFLIRENKGTKGAVRFLLKNLEINKIEFKNKDLYKSYLLNILANDTRSLVKACSLLCDNTVILSTKDIDMISNQLKFHINKKNDLEVIWLIYLLIKQNKLDISKIEQDICKLNDLAKLILYKNVNLSSKTLGKIIDSSKSWLVLYELFFDNKINEEQFVNKLEINRNKDFYKRLKSNAISFCKKIQNN